MVLAKNKANLPFPSRLSRPAEADVALIYRGQDAHETQGRDALATEAATQVRAEKTKPIFLPGGLCELSGKSVFAYKASP